jgi:hypothetical protein
MGPSGLTQRLLSINWALPPQLGRSPRRAATSHGPKSPPAPVLITIAAVCGCRYSSLILVPPEAGVMPHPERLGRGFPLVSSCCNEVLLISGPSLFRVNPSVLRS